MAQARVALERGRHRGRHDAAHPTALQHERDPMRVRESKLDPAAPVSFPAASVTIAWRSCATLASDGVTERKAIYSNYGKDVDFCAPSGTVAPPSRCG